MSQNRLFNPLLSRDFLKCDQCRNDRKKCLPQLRDWNETQQKCDRCYRQGYPCGPSVRKPKALSEMQDTSIEQKLFACPFAVVGSALADSEDIVEKQYRDCASRGFRNISDLREHLEGAHFRAELRCRGCLTPFDSEDAMSRHLYHNETCSKDGPDLLEKQRSKIRSFIQHNIGSMSEPLMWEEIYNILFPEKTLPSSPFVGEPILSSTAASTHKDISKRPQTTSPEFNSKFSSLMVTDAQSPDDISRTLQHQYSMPKAPPAGDYLTPEQQIRKFASQLFDDMNGRKFDVSGADTLCNELPTLLADFALRLGQGRRNLEARRAMVFIYQYRNVLCDYLLSLIVASPKEEKEDTPQQTRNDSSLYTYVTEHDRDLAGIKKSPPGPQPLSKMTETPPIEQAEHKNFKQPQKIGNQSRTSCVTCMTRRVKCDELKPECMRCTSTGRKCEGYTLPVSRSSVEDEMSTAEKMQLWQNRLDHPGGGKSPLEAIEHAIDLEQSKDNEKFNKYVEIAVKDYSYGWLLGMLRNRTLLTPRDDGVMSHIRDSVHRVLPKITNPRLSRAPVSKVVFEVLWPLRSFLLRNFVDADHVDIARIVTMTGQLRDAQALTCKQYMEQTWPCTGVHLLQLVQQLMDAPPLSECHSRRPDGATMKIREENRFKLYLMVIGTSDVAAEIAEQLSWLSAALGTFPETKTVVSSTPSIHHTIGSIDPRASFPGKVGWGEYRDYGSIEADYSFRAGRGSYHFRIEVLIQDVDLILAPGLCWSQMIRQSNIVRGFPIRRRQQSGIGLEIPLEIAAELVGTKYVNTFAGQSFVKAYSAMLLPTIQYGDLLVWHLSVSSTEQHLSYHNHGDIPMQKIKIQDIERLRHIIGWCSSALNYAGVADGHYSVRRARLPKADTECILVDDTLSFGVPLIGHAPFILSEQQRMTWAGRSGYSAWLRYLSQKFVLFWDKRDQRGWLVNGVNALLHLIRASLVVDERDSAASEFLLKSTDLKEPWHPYSAKAPREFLGWSENLRARLSLTKIGTKGNPTKPEPQDEYETLHDRTEQYFHVLEKAVTYSEKLQDVPAKPTKGKSAFRLEGWDFVDLVERVEPIDPRAVMLSAESHSWLELVRSAGITTFFGQGFGELIRPTYSNCCKAWKTLPTGKHYIAANITDIKRIMDLKGDPDSRPRRLTTTLLWHHPVTAFQNCGCRQPGRTTTSLVQQLCSTRRTCLCPDLNHADLELDDYDTGAVVFGYNPEYGPLPEIENDDEFEDSGIGSSLTETTSQSSSLAPLSTQHDSVVRQYGDGHVSGGKAYFGDTVHYTINNYGHTLPPVRQPDMLEPHSETSHPRIQEAPGTKRGYSNSQVGVPFLTEQQPENMAKGSSSGESKRIKKTK